MAERRVKIPLYNYDYNYKEVIAEPLNTRKTRNHNFPFFSISDSEKRQRHGKKPFPNDSLKVN